MTPKIQKLADTIITLEKQARAIEDKYEMVFTKWRELQQEKESIISIIKTEARKHSVEGESRVLFDSADLHISVSGRRCPISYDWSTAKKLWPKTVVEACTVKELDPKIVAHLIEDGAIDPDTIPKVRKFGELPTPAVTVKLP